MFRLPSGSETNLGGRRKARCIRTGDCLQRGPLCGISWRSGEWQTVRALCTVHVYVVVPHVLAQCGEPLGSADFLDHDGWDGGAVTSTGCGVEECAV